MDVMCNLTQKEERVPEDWTKTTTCIVTIYKGNGSKGECGSYKGIMHAKIKPTRFGSEVST